MGKAKTDLFIKLYKTKGVNVAYLNRVVGQLCRHHGETTVVSCDRPINRLANVKPSHHSISLNFPMSPVKTQVFTAT